MYVRNLKMWGRHSEKFLEANGRAMHVEYKFIK